MRKSLWRRIFFGLLAVFVPLALFLAVEHLRGRRALDREMATLRAQGEKLTVAELLPPVPSPDENGAPEFQSAACLLSGTVVPDEVPGAWKPVAAGKVRLATQSRQWPRLNKGKGTNFITAEQLEQDIQGVQDHLNLIHAALRKPALNFVSYYSLKSMMLPHLVPSKRAAQWLRAASLHSLFASDLEGSLVNLESLGALSRKQTEERLLISQLVGIAEASIGFGATWEALQSPGWNETQLARLQAAWSEPNYVKRMAEALEMERALGSEFHEQLTADDLETILSDWMAALNPPANPPALPTSLDETVDFIGSLSEATASGFRRVFYFRLWRIAWADQDHAQLLRKWQTAIEGARNAAKANSYLTVKKSATEDSTIFWPVSDERKKQISFYDRLRFPVSEQLGDYYWRAISRAFVAETWRVMTVTAIALQRYQLRHGKAAPDLKALAPEFLAVEPRDPMDGQPLRYRSKPEGGFVLYSVGEDGVDDGGDARPPQSSNQTTPAALSVTRGRDLVWPVSATEEEITAAEAKGKR